MSDRFWNQSDTNNLSRSLSDGLALIHHRKYRCNRTEQLAVYFNFASFWPRQVGFFDWQLQAQKRHNFNFSVFHIQEIYSTDTCTAYDQYQIRNSSNYHWKYTYKWNYMVVAEPNGEQFFIYLHFNCAVAWIHTYLVLL